MNRLNANNDLSHNISDMAGGNMEAVSVMMQMLSLDKARMLELAFLDDKQIYGKNIATLFKSCCDSDIHKFILCIRMLQLSEFPVHRIHENLEKAVAEPFLDREIPLDNTVYDLDNDMILNKSKFYEYCLAQKEMYLKKHPNEDEVE